jgi:hypothetical protein
MEQRQHHELHGPGRDEGGNAEVDAIPQHHAVGDDRALGMPGGARGVHHHADIVVRQGDGRRDGRIGSERALVGAVGPLVIDLDEMRHAASLGELAGGGGEALVVDQELGGGIAQDIFELRHGEPPVERQHDGTDAAASELKLEIFGAVRGEKGDAIAPGDPQRCQRGGQAIAAAVEIGVAELPFRLQIVDRELTRPPAGMMGDPVVVGRDAGHGQLAARPSASISRTPGSRTEALPRTGSGIGVGPWRMVERDERSKSLNR